MSTWVKGLDGKLVPQSELRGQIQKLRAAKKKAAKKAAKKARKAKRGRPSNKLTDRIIEKWENYPHYCQSKAFKIWKAAVLKRDKHRCQRCGEKATVAHHLKYRRWGTEKLSDGVALCNFCHTKVYHADKELDREYDTLMKCNS